MKITQIVQQLNKHIDLFPKKYLNSKYNNFQKLGYHKLISNEKTFLIKEKNWNQERKLVVISGAGAATANTPILMFLEKGYIVIALTSNEKKLELNNKNSNLRYVYLDRKDTGNNEKIKEAIRKALKELSITFVSEVVGVNLIGGSVAPKGSTLNYLNYELPLSFMESVSEAATQTGSKCSLVNISSIAATINGTNGCDYAEIKDLTDREMLKMKTQKGNVIALRPGVICPEIDCNNIVNMGHDYSPEQFYNSLFIPVIGTGNQIQQPVSEQELYEAAINGVELENKSVIIDAVGSDAMTQKEMLGYFNQKKEKWVIHLPYELAEQVAIHYPWGRIAPYSVRLFKTLDKNQTVKMPIDGSQFNQFLRRKAKGFTEIYNKEREIIGRKNPIIRHTKFVIKETLSNPEKGYTFVKNIFSSIRKIQISMFEDNRI
jgi:NADP-dependent 3-hydroxy acid dehydrogenase YdfG